MQAGSPHNGNGNGRESTAVTLKNAIILVAVIMVAVLVIVRFDDVLKALSALWGVIEPLLIGAAIAYILNLIMSRLERIWFPNSENIVARKSRRPVCLILSIAIVAAFLAVVIAIMSNELRSALPALGEGLLTLVSGFNDWLASSSLIDNDAVAYVSALLTGDEEAWAESIEAATAYIEDYIEDIGGYGSLATAALDLGQSVVGFFFDLIVTVVFAIYLLAGKENVIKAGKNFGKWALSKRAYRRVSHILSIANNCFSHFFFGQFIEGCILGTICGVCMAIMQMPYAASIGLCVGVTSFVPLIGAWVGGIVGALILLSVSPMQAVWFVVFIVVLQQIEGHLIYPNVVGTSVGIPSIWVLVSVFVGGTLFGIPGVIMGVPLTGTLLQLWKERGEGFRGKYDHLEPDDPDDAGDPSHALEAGQKARAGDDAAAEAAPEAGAGEAAGEDGGSREGALAGAREAPSRT